MLPMNDPYLLLCIINTKLRDNYSNLDDLCEDLDVSKEQIISKLKEIQYVYDEQKNAFVSNKCI